MGGVGIKGMYSAKGVIYGIPRHKHMIENVVKHRTKEPRDSKNGILCVLITWTIKV